MSIKELTAATFDQTLESNTLIVVDFWAEWCGPCKTFGKIMSAVASDYPTVTFASVNTEKETALAEEFAVRSIPFVMIIRSRVVVYAESGALPESELRRLIDQAQSLTEEELQK